MQFLFIVSPYLISVWDACVIWYYLYNVEHVKSSHEQVVFLVKLQVKARNFTKINYFTGVFRVFKIVQMVTNSADHHIFLEASALYSLFVLHRMTRRRMKYLQKLITLMKFWKVRMISPVSFNPSWKRYFWT